MILMATGFDVRRSYLVSSCQPEATNNSYDGRTNPLNTSPKLPFPDVESQSTSMPERVSYELTYSFLPHIELFWVDMA